MTDKELWDYNICDRVCHKAEQSSLYQAMGVTQAYAAGQMACYGEFTAGRYLVRPAVFLSPRRYARHKAWPRSHAVNALGDEKRNKVLTENKPILKRENVTELMDNPFLKYYDYGYFPGRHYYVASRHEGDALVALKSKKEFQNMMPDAVSCVVILKCKDREPLLCLTKEMRYPVGQFLLGVPAGLLDPEDQENENAVFNAAKRELWEETGISWEKTDEIKMINPLLFSSPGMTDESNAIVQMVLNRDEFPKMNSDGAVGGECFDGFVLLDREKAKKILKDGMDGEGLFYSVYTWIALTCFVTDLWE